MLCIKLSMPYSDGGIIMHRHPMPIQSPRRITDTRGTLVCHEANVHIPFNVRSVAYTHGVPHWAMRGGHAHYELQQFLKCVAGEVTVSLTDTNGTIETVLTDLLLCKPLLFGEQCCTSIIKRGTVYDGRLGDILFFHLTGIHLDVILGTCSFANGVTGSMELKNALAGQYRATLKMLRDCVERCPETLWDSDGGPERPFWRITYHAAFYTHLYLMPTEHDFVPTDGHQHEATCLWGPENIPMEPLSKEFVTNYIIDIDSNVDMYLNAIDLSSESSGFHWYSLPKLDHILLNLRHLGIHVGQLQERLYAAGVDVPWVSKG